MFVGNWIATGNPVRSVTLDGGQNINLQGQETILQKANSEEPKFNGYIVQLRDEPVSKIYVNELKNVEKGTSSKTIVN